MLSSILSIWSPDNGDLYKVPQDLGAMVADIEDAILNPPYIRLRQPNLASYTSTSHAFQVGLTGNENVVMDRLSILARNGGAPSTLSLNAQGGDVRIGSFGARVIIPANLDGASISWATSAGTEEFAATTAGTTRTRTVTLPSGRFTATPKITVTVDSTSPHLHSASVSFTSATSFDITYANMGGFTIDTPRVHWHAVQMRSNGGDG